MKSFISFVVFCVVVANAQLISGSSGLGSPYSFGYPGGYPGGIYGGLYGNCPVNLLTTLSSIVSSLYGYGSYPGIGNYYGFGGLSGGFGAAYGAGGSPFSSFQATSGTTTNPYNPTCPWPLINGMIAQIQQYVNQLQTAETGAPNALAFAGGYAGTPFAAGRGGPFGAAYGAGPVMGVGAGAGPMMGVGAGAGPVMGMSPAGGFRPGAAMGRSPAPGSRRK